MIVPPSQHENCVAMWLLFTRRRDAQRKECCPALCPTQCDKGVMLAKTVLLLLELSHRDCLRLLGRRFICFLVRHLYRRLQGRPKDSRRRHRTGRGNLGSLTHHTASIRNSICQGKGTIFMVLTLVHHAWYQASRLETAVDGPKKPPHDCRLKSNNEYPCARNSQLPRQWCRSFSPYLSYHGRLLGRRGSFNSARQLFFQLLSQREAFRRRCRTCSGSFRSLTFHTGSIRNRV